MFATKVGSEGSFVADIIKQFLRKEVHAWSEEHGRVNGLCDASGFHVLSGSGGFKAFKSGGCGSRPGDNSARVKASIKAQMRPYVLDVSDNANSGQVYGAMQLKLFTVLRAGRPKNRFVQVNIEL